ncbi:hypothetical protein Tco_1259348, partial [Tanacetum coccineum]
MDFNFNNENEPWEFSLDIDDFDLHLTPVVHSSSITHVEPSPYTPNPVRIIPGPAGIVQLSSSTRVEASSSTPNPVRIQYVWSLENSGEFSVKSIRQVIDANCFLVIHSAT